MMLAQDIHIRDPFILPENGVYYLYGTRASHFGMNPGGFDVYTSRDLIHWSEPKEIFDSSKFDLNRGVNWAPEVHAYQGSYYLFATFTQKNSDNRGTFILKSDAPDGQFLPHSDGSITPNDWFALDGTFYVENGVPYMVFCHEHVQILNGTVEAVRLTDDLKQPASDPFTLFRGSDAYEVPFIAGERYVTDGPFLHRHENGALSLIWSTGVQGKYAQCRALSDNGSITGHWTQQPHLFTEDGGHGMIFQTFDGGWMLTLHRPNRQPDERPAFLPLSEVGSVLSVQ